MPRIRCPNCGTTINLENRREIDFSLIKKATKRRPSTFTELLHITGLPRKTLSLRLKELCTTGALVKNEHMYELNGASSFEGESSMKKYSKVFQNGKIRTGFMLLALLVCFSASGYVVARYLSVQPLDDAVPQGPEILGTFTMALDINDVNNLYDWQVAIVYDSSKLEVQGIAAGDFLLEDYPFFLNSTDSFEDLVLLAGCLKGASPGKSGSGRLATITFGYFTEDYEGPHIVEEKVFETILRDPEGNLIPIEESTLALTVIGS